MLWLHDKHTSMAIYIPLILGVFVPLKTEAPIPVKAITVASQFNPIVHLQPVHRKQNSSDLPVPPRNPSSSSAGGRRDAGVCPEDVALAETEPVLTAFSPNPGPGLTLVERPTFLIYIPPTSATTAEFSLRTLDERGIYRTTLALNGIPGIISVSLPASVPPLEVGNTYIWSFNLICTPNNRLEDQFVTGTVQRTTLDPGLEQSMTQVRSMMGENSLEVATAYEEANLWYDALSILFALHQTQPEDSRVDQLWKNILQSGGLGTFEEQPVDR